MDAKKHRAAPSTQSDGQALSRFRALLFAVSLLMAALAALHLILGDSRPGGAWAWAALGIAWLVLWWVSGFRYSAFHLLGELPAWCALVAVAYGLDGPDRASGVFFVSLFFRMQYGSRARAALVIASYVSAFIIAVALTRAGRVPLWAEGNLEELPALALLGAAFYFIRGVLESQDRSARMGTALAQYAGEFLSAADRETINAVLAAGARAIGADAAGVTWEIVPPHAARQDWLDGVVAGSAAAEDGLGGMWAPAHVARVSALPPELWARFRAEEEVLVVPLRGGNGADGALVVGGPGLTPPIRRAFSIFGSQASLAYTAETLRGNRFRSLVQHSSEVIAIVCPDGILQYASPAAERLTGFTPGELEGRPLGELFADGDEMRLPDIPKLLATGNGGNRFEAAIRRRDGSLRIVEALATNMTEEPSVCGIVLNVRDVTESSRTKQQLRASEARIRAILESAHDPFISADSAGRIREWNPAAERTFGWSRDEVVGRPLTGTVIPARYAAAFEAGLRSFLRSGKSTLVGRRAEFPASRRDGSEIIVEVALTAVPDGDAWLFHSFLYDVTEERRALEALRHSEISYRTLFNSLTEGVYVLDPDGRFLAVNDAVTNMYGYDREEIVGNTPAMLAAPDGTMTLEETYAAIRQAADGHPQRFKWLGRRRNGEVFPKEVVLSRGTYFGRQVVIAVARDISERERARAELEGSNRRLRTLIQASPIAIVALDETGLVTTWNPAAERTFGWTAEEVLGRRPLFVPAETRPRHEELLARVLGGEALYEILLRRVRKDGELLDIRLSAAPLTDAEGNPRGAIALLADMTEWMRLEAEVRQSQKMEAFGALAGGVAHDFNNILTVIQGNTSLLLADNAEAGAEPPQDLVEVARAADRARALVRQLLAFSRKQVLQPRVLDLNSVVADTDKMLRRLIASDVELVTLLEPEVPYIRADSGQLEQVLMNLAVNARDAMPSGGRVVIETGIAVLTAPLRTSGSLVPPGEYACLWVTDSGPGIAPEHLPRIFEPFFTTKPNGKGTGLGLSTVYGIIRQSGGYVWAECPPAGGARFSIYLPAVDEAPDSDAPAPAPVQENAHGKTILLVEDEATVRRVTRRILESAGYTVVEAENGEQAMRLWTSTAEDIDLLVTDMVMPLLTGRELATRLRACAPTLPVLFTSGYTDQDPWTLVEEPSAFVAKPFLPSALLGAVRGLLQTRGIEACHGAGASSRAAHDVIPEPAQNDRP
ncbi:MAG TPA: PAS domain S-box protein [Longimicrobium sp.]